MQDFEGGTPILVHFAGKPYRDEADYSSLARENERLNAEIKTVYDRLQAAHEECDRLREVFKKIISNKTKWRNLKKLWDRNKEIVGDKLIDQVEAILAEYTAISDDVAALAAPQQAEERPLVVCLCGSTRFYDQFRKSNLSETLKGNIVLSIGCDFKSDDALGLTDDDKKRLDELHKRKIDLASEVLVLNVGGYIGESTQSEIEYAKAHDKPVRYLEAEERSCATCGDKACPIPSLSPVPCSHYQPPAPVASTVIPRVGDAGLMDSGSPIASKVCRWLRVNGYGDTVIYKTCEGTYVNLPALGECPFCGGKVKEVKEEAK